MERDTIHRILFTADGDPVAEQILNLLRRAGLRVEAHDAPTTAELVDALAGASWHLVCALTSNPAAPVPGVLAHLRETGIDVPCVVIDDRPGHLPAEAALQHGAVDVFPAARLQEESGRAFFVHRVGRELDCLAQRNENRRLHGALRSLRDHHQQLLDRTTDPIAWLSDGLYQYCNPAWLDFLGYREAAALLHTPLLDQIREEDVETVRRHLQAAARGEQPEQRCALRIAEQNGSWLPVEMSCQTIESDGEALLLVRLAPATGTTEQHNAAHEQAGRDLVTGLAGRQRMLDRITGQIHRSVQGGGTAVLEVLELDNFDAVRSVLGRADSNLLLGDFAEALRRHYPPHAQAGRISDSGFAVLQEQAEDAPDPTATRKALDDELQTLIPERLECHLSGGTAVISRESADAETILVRAQHNRVLRSTRRADLGSANRQQRQLDRLRAALDEQRLTLVYQPVVSLHEDGQARYEVRMRLQEGEQVIEPAEFLEIANRHGLGGTLDRHVIILALDMLASHSEDESLRLFLNVTLNSITDGTLPGWLAEELRRRRIPADRLIIQLSELDILSATEEATRFCSRLHELETGLSITHFGCAMEPLQQARSLSPAYCKLDRSVVSDIDRDAGRRERLQQLIGNLHAQGILAVAPMVEQMEMLPLLWQARVNFVQGNVLREPSPSLDFHFVHDEEITLDSTSGRSR